MSRFIAFSVLALALTACSTAAETSPPQAPAPARSTAAQGTPFSVASSNRIVERDERAAISGANSGATPDDTGNASTEHLPPCDLWLKNVPDGVAILFVPHGESLETLRQRVRSVADDQNALGGKPDELTAIPIEPKLDIPVHAVERNTVRGAELVLTTSRAADVVTLRALVEWHEADMLPNMTRSRSEPATCPTTRLIQKPA